MTRGAGARGPDEDPVDEPEQRAGEVSGAQPVDGGELTVDHRFLYVGVRHDGVHQRCDVRRILVVVQDAGAVHRRRHGRGGVGQHRNLLVERLDERHAEALVLARAQEEIGDLVERHQFLVRDLPDEMDVGVAERRRQLVERRHVALEPALRADQEQPRPRVVERVIRVKEADHVFDLLVRHHTADEQDVGPGVVEQIGDRAIGVPVEMREIRHHRQHGRSS